MFSKFYGIKFIAELKHIGQGKLIVLLGGISWLTLLLFALVQAPFNIIFLFVNGFPWVLSGISYFPLWKGEGQLILSVPFLQ